MTLLEAEPRSTRTMRHPERVYPEQSRREGPIITTQDVNGYGIRKIPK